MSINLSSIYLRVFFKVEYFDNLFEMWIILKIFFKKLNNLREKFKIFTENIHPI